MTHEYSPDRILEIECRVLRAICGAAASLSPEVRDAAIRDLAGYNWRAAEHRVVYAALARIQQTSGAAAAEQLPAQATRMGFPDVDWELYLQPTEGAVPDIRALILNLKDAKDAALL
jgi:hypothetical protein